uniref:Xylulose kinase-1 n=1 Tax=Tanacetum cinerariifolium TaxID=118510 RepID=A0A6L2KNG3_TANCI|nr:hypothetical protein [Tanacetum cinerariifolium]
MAPLTFADTHNMITFLTKLDASEGFDQIVDFLNAHMIQYALMVNPTIYVTRIKKFWTSISIKKSVDVVRLQALIDKKKVIITEDTIRPNLRLNDADGVDCLPNEEIFAELARMGYEKPSTKLTFYKVFFSAQCKFLIHTILQCMSAKRTTWNDFSSSMASSVICLAIVDDLSSHNTKYTSPTLTQKVFANMRRIGKEFSGVDTPLFDETCATLTKQVANLEQDKIVQAIEITKLKQRVRRLEKKRQFKSSRLMRLRKVGTTQRVESSADTVMDDQEDAFKQGGITELDADEDVTLVDAEEDMNANIQERLAESQAKVYHLDLQHAEKVLSMHDTDEAEPVEVEEVIEVVTAAKLMTEIVTTATTTINVAQVPKASTPRRRRGVVIQDLEETSTTSIIDEAFARQLETELNANINWDDVMEQVKRREKQDNTVMRYQALKRKPVTEAQARKNMMIYLKNMAVFKMDLFKGMTYSDIRPIFEKHYNSIQAFLDKGEKDIKEERNKRKANDDDDVYTEATPLALKVPVVDYQIYHEHNKPYYKIIRADGTHQLFLSFITLLKNFNKEDLEALWKLVKERFESTEPKNFSDDFLLNTLKIMFEKPNVEASMIILVEKKYPLTHFTLEQMLNNVTLEVEEESKMSLELLRTSRNYVKGLRLLVEELVLLVHIDDV